MSVWQNFLPADLPVGNIFVWRLFRVDEFLLGKFLAPRIYRSMTSPRSETPDWLNYTCKIPKTKILLIFYSKSQIFNVNPTTPALMNSHYIYKYSTRWDNRPNMQHNIWKSATLQHISEVELKLINLSLAMFIFNDN